MRPVAMPVCGLEFASGVGVEAADFPTGSAHPRPCDEHLSGQFSGRRHRRSHNLYARTPINACPSPILGKIIHYLNELLASCMQPAPVDDVQMERVVHGIVTPGSTRSPTHWLTRSSQVRGLGAAIAIDIDGESVLDLWGGYADAAQTKQWAEGTIVNVWSSTKTVTSLTALMTGRSRAGLEHPVACLAGVRRQQAGHRGATSVAAHGGPDVCTVHDRGRLDWDKSTSQLARQAPWWPPGTASGYHALTFGHLIGELVRRTAGMSLKDFVRGEIAGPLEADFQIGALADDHDRIAELIPPPPFDIPFDALPEDSPMRKTFTTPVPTRKWLARHNGEPPTSAPSTGTEMHGRWRECCRRSHWAARLMVFSCFVRRRSNRSSPCSPTVWTWCWACRCAWVLATACPHPDRADGARREDLLLGRLGWLDGAHQPGPSYDGRLCDEQNGPGHAR